MTSITDAEREDLDALVRLYPLLPEGGWSLEALSALCDKGLAERRDDGTWYPTALGIRTAEGDRL